MTAINNTQPKEEKKDRVPRVMLTTKQKRILDKLLAKDGSRRIKDTRSAALDLGISTAALYNSNKRVYQNFRGLLDAMITYYPIFERRFKHDEEAYSKLRKLARTIRKE